MNTVTSQLQNFSVRQANADAGLRDQIHRLRYQVYCIEHKFLDATRYPHQREADEFDDSSLHFCTVGEDSSVAAAVRLVPDGSRGLPLMQYCSLFPREHDAIVSGQLRTAEASRLVTVRGSGARGSPHMILRLYAEVFRTAKLLGFKQLVGATETALVRLLARYRLPMRQIGPEAEFGGRVTPFAVLISDFDRMIASGDCPLWNQCVTVSAEMA